MLHHAVSMYMKIETMLFWWCIVWYFAMACTAGKHRRDCLWQHHENDWMTPTIYTQSAYCQQNQDETMRKQECNVIENLVAEFVAGPSKIWILSLTLLWMAGMLATLTMARPNSATVLALCPTPTLSAMVQIIARIVSPRWYYLNLECASVVFQCQCNTKENGIINTIELGENCLNNHEKELMQVILWIWCIQYGFEWRWNAWLSWGMPRQCFHDYHSFSCGLPKTNLDGKEVPVFIDLCL